MPAHVSVSASQPDLIGAVPVVLRGPAFPLLFAELLAVAGQGQGEVVLVVRERGRAVQPISGQRAWIARFRGRGWVGELPVGVSFEEVC